MKKIQMIHIFNFLANVLKVYAYVYNKKLCKLISLKYR